MNDAEGKLGLPWVVILARGDSRRMGRPKGAVCLPGRQETMLQMVCRLYPAQLFRRLVVTREDLLPVYQPLLGGEGAVQWVCAPAGGSTAGTVAAALAAVPQDEGAGGLLLAHPVDVPLVRGATRDLLLRTLAHAEVPVVRPVFRGRPGHPVVFRREPLRRLLARIAAPELERNSLGQILQRALPAEAMRLLDVEDEGVVRDFDTPGDLEGLK